MPVINCGNVKLKGSKESLQALFAHLAPKPKAHTVELVYLETCNSSYFQGFGGQVYAVPVEGRPRVADVKKGLLFEIHSMELWIGHESAPAEDYASLEEQVIALFKGTHPFRAWGPQHGPYGEDCYAYFGVKVHEEAE